MWWATSSQSKANTEDSREGIQPQDGNAAILSELPACLLPYRFQAQDGNTSSYLLADGGPTLQVLTCWSLYCGSQCLKPVSLDLFPGEPRLTHLHRQLLPSAGRCGLLLAVAFPPLPRCGIRICGERLCVPSWH